MRNPFIYGEAVTGRDFCDRKREIEKLLNDLLDSQKVFLISSRRMGKTSLIKVVLKKLNEKGFITIFLDIEGITTYKKFLNLYFNTLIEKFTGMKKVYEFIKKLLPGIKVELKIDEYGKPKLSLDYSPREIENEEIDRKIFSLPEKLSLKKPVVIAFDEFQEILKLNGGRIEATLCSSIQHQRRVGYIFAGSKRSLLSHMVNSLDSPFYRIGPVMYLDKIPEREFAKFIYDKFKKTGIKIKYETVLKIIQVADEIPYYVQMFSHELWDLAVSTRKRILEKDVEAVFTQLITQYDENFREVWSRLISSKRQILNVIARRGGKNLMSKDTIQMYELPYPASIQKTLESLIKDGYIDKVKDEYFIVDILFREWIRRCTI